MDTFYIVGIVSILIICFLIISISKYKNKRKKRTRKKEQYYYPDMFLLLDENDNTINTIKKKYDSWNEIGQTYLKYIHKINDENYYLTWRFSGNNLRGENSYNLILLSYKNKQNEFKIHLKDYLYLKPFYEKYNLYDDSMKDILNKMVFATNEYNTNKEDYLELEHIDDITYIIKGSIWAKRGPMNYLHIDDKNKLYFDQGINQNVAKFTIV